MHRTHHLFSVRSQTNHSVVNCSATVSVEESLIPRHGGNYAKLGGSATLTVGSQPLGSLDPANVQLQDLRPMECPRLIQR